MNLMNDKEAVIEKILGAFQGNEYPGDDYLQGSMEGSEPYEEVSPFRGKTDWRAIKGDFLDARAWALSFFSEAGFRFFLPAYLIADLNGMLSVADPLFHLTHGFSDTEVKVPAGGRVFVMRHGKSAFINPRRYGAATFHDYARYRLSVFTREEAGAIAAYLEFKRDNEEYPVDKEGIDAALNLFWLERARTAPLAEDLRKHIEEQEEYISTLRSDVREDEEP
jgi:hypothetical protein